MERLDITERKFKCQEKKLYKPTSLSYNKNMMARKIGLLFSSLAFLLLAGGSLFGVDASCVSCHTSERKMQNLFVPPVQSAGGEQGEG
jgi:mono/diheme cytochrome c family protein